MNIRIFLVAISILTVVSLGRCSEYFVAFLGQDIQDDIVISETIKYEVVVTNPGDVPANFTIRDVKEMWKDETLQPKAILTSVFKQPASMNGTEIANKSVRISSDKDVVVQVFFYTSDHIEGYLAIPVDHLGRVYQVSTFCALGGYCQLAVAATHPNVTQVYLQFPLSVPEIVFCVGKKFFRSKRDRFFNLSEFDVLQIETAADLTGAFIYADRPVAVFAGTRNLTMGGAKRHLVEQLSPAHRWGKEFVLGNLGENNYGDIIKITAAMDNTRVSMRGFPDFIIHNTNHTVTRRLDKGTVSYIRADQQIQVIQFSGITYASNGENPHPAMTVVPAVGTFKKKYTLSCGKESDLKAQYHTAVHKTENGSVTVDVGTEESSINLLYTPFNVKKFSMDPPQETFTAETTGELPFGGTLVCNKTAAMPMTFPTEEENIPVPSDTSKCIEDQTFDFVYDRYAETLSTRRVTIGNYDNIKLRVKTCGHAVIALYKEYGQNTRGRVVLTLTHGKILVTKCDPNCGRLDTYTDDSYNNVSGKNCNLDMSFYWIHQNKEATKVCFGYGLYPDASDCNKELATDFTFSVMELGGVGHSVFYSFDLHVQNCVKYIADWRCDDNVDCARFQKDICSNDIYKEWTRINCRKYCKLCETDTYGRRFLAIIRRNDDAKLCEIHVSWHNYNAPNIAVGSKLRILLGKRVDETAIFDCTGLDYLTDVSIWIISDKDVFVTMVFKTKFDRIGAYPVYPVDALGKEILGITDDGAFMNCYLATVDFPAEVTVFYDEAFGNKGNLGVTDGHSINLQPGMVHEIRGTFSHLFKGVLFRADRPVYVYCGDYFVIDFSVGTQFFQTPPTDNLGKEYITPSFEPVIVERPFDATLLIQAVSDNTLVTIRGDFDAIIPIYKRGDYARQPIEAGSSYSVTANNNINVAMILKDVYDDKRKFFFLIPPHTQSTLKQHTVYIPLNTGAIMSEFTPTKWQSYSVQNGKTTYMNERQTVTGDQTAHHETSLESDKYYTVSVVFNDDNQWIVFPGPRHFNRANIHGLCRTNVSAVGDGIDNDCDGLKDEDVCFSGYGIFGNDYDLDGGFGEDCGTKDTESTGLPEPIHPLCIPIDKPDGQCWTVCSCQCSWVEKLEAKETMTDEEIKELEDADIAKYQDALKVDTEKLTSETSKYESASDERQSATTVGVLGICMFSIVFGCLFLMDVRSLYRDMLIAIRNLREGLERLWDFINGE